MLHLVALDSNSIREQLLSIRVGIESGALDSSWNREQRSRCELESKAIALYSNSNREQLLSIPTGIESTALDSNSNREQLLSNRVGIDSNCHPLTPGGSGGEGEGTRTRPVFFSPKNAPDMFQKCFKHALKMLQGVASRRIAFTKHLNEVFLPY